jgi:hypothetical protein
MEVLFMLAETICAWCHGALHHFHYCSEDGSTYSVARTTLSVDKNWYYTATDACYLRKLGLKKRAERMESRENKYVGSTLSKSHFQHMKSQLSMLHFTNLPYCKHPFLSANPTLSIHVAENKNGAGNK